MRTDAVSSDGLGFDLGGERRSRLFQNTPRIGNVFVFVPHRHRGFRNAEQVQKFAAFVRDYGRETTHADVVAVKIHREVV